VRAYMEDEGVDLVVVGTHGRNGAFDVRLGGTAKRILEFAPGDVLLIREPKAVSSDAARARLGARTRKDPRMAAPSSEPWPWSDPLKVIHPFCWS